MIRALVIGEKTRQDIAKVLAYAEANKYNRQTMEKLQKGIGVIPGDIPEHICRIDVGFRVVCTIEEQPMGWSKHISVSVDNPKKLPSIVAVQAIIEAFGIKQKLEECAVWLEETIVPHAVNVVARLEANK